LLDKCLKQQYTHIIQTTCTSTKQKTLAFSSKHTKQEHILCRLANAVWRPWTGSCRQSLQETCGKPSVKGNEKERHC